MYRAHLPLPHPASKPVKWSLRELIGKIENSKILDDILKINNPCIKFEYVGYKNKEELDLIYSKTHLAISSMALDKIQFKMDSGNIDAGDICLYGIK